MAMTVTVKLLDRRAYRVIWVSNHMDRRAYPIWRRAVA
jgi:hypothetical protein